MSDNTKLLMMSTTGTVHAVYMKGKTACGRPVTANWTEYNPDEPHTDSRWACSACSHGGDIIEAGRPVTVCEYCGQKWLYGYAMRHRHIMFAKEKP